jgi:hypothetical protein
LKRGFFQGFEYKRRVFQVKLNMVLREILELLVVNTYYHFAGERKGLF